MGVILEFLAFFALIVTIIAGLMQIADRLGKKNGKSDRN